MTDLLIRGMKMPKTCQICRAARLDRLIDCSLWQRVRSISLDKHRNCPLIEVPTPHGRLIDADALMLAILDAQVDQPELAEVYDEDYHVVLDWLRAAPTVIEAEE